MTWEDVKEALHEIDSNNSEDSNSDGEDRTTRASTAAKQRQAQNEIFEAWLSERAVRITEKQVSGDKTDKAGKQDEVQSTRSLIAEQQSKVIIHDPREYQLEIFEKAKTHNVIAVLPTGSGKTLIAVLLIRHVLDIELEICQAGQKPRVIFFLVDKVPLAIQQSRVLESNLDQPTLCLYGELGCDEWDPGAWAKLFEENRVIICTADILDTCLGRGRISMARINLLVFDEAHHAKKNHPFARIMRNFYHQTSVEYRPKVFGMTASPHDTSEDPAEAAKNLEYMLSSQIITASDQRLLQNVIGDPEVEKHFYEKCSVRQDTQLTAKIRAEFGDSLASIFRQVEQVTTELGPSCADSLWRFALSEEQIDRVEKKLERQASIADPSGTELNDDMRFLRRARQLMNDFHAVYGVDPWESVSPKVQALLAVLNSIYAQPTAARTIVFVKERVTARILGAYLSQFGPPFLRSGILIGTTGNDIGGEAFSFREQVLAQVKFRNGELNCLLATSVAEEGLDVPECNAVIRFDLCQTLIQFIQSRGRARDPASKYIHLLEEGNRHHNAGMDKMTIAEKQMHEFCRSLPQNRLVTGYDDNHATALATCLKQEVYVDPATGATLSYDSSVPILAQFTSTLSAEEGGGLRPSYYTTKENGFFVCEVTLPEASPLQKSQGKQASRKSVAKRSAAFNACCLLRQAGYLDENLRSTYRKHLPKMRNAQLALNCNRSNAYEMLIKPSVWTDYLDSFPTELYVTIVGLERADHLHPRYRPFILLTRLPMPIFPSFEIYLHDETSTSTIFRSFTKPLRLNESQVTAINQFTLRLYWDIHNKEFEENVGGMSYWLVPASSRVGDTDEHESLMDLIDWHSITYVHENKDLQWTEEYPSENLPGKYFIDPLNGGRRFFSLAVDNSLKLDDPVPSVSTESKKSGNILDFTLGFRTAVKTKYRWDMSQPIMKAQELSCRLNRLEEASAKENERSLTCYICPQPLEISALPVDVVSMAYLCPAIITRLESYLIALQAFTKLGLDLPLELALEALTKDSNKDGTDEDGQFTNLRGMGKNYERLEFIGDSFLKLATSIALYVSKPANDEFSMHVDRMVLVCNKNLLNNALNQHLFKFIRSSGFSRRLWYQQGIKLLAGRGFKKPSAQTQTHQLADKTIADVCEAMIGACLVSRAHAHDFDMAVKAVTAMVGSDDHRAEKWADYYSLYGIPKFQLAPASASQLDLAGQIAAKLGYRFTYPRLLRCAFLHPSYPYIMEKIPSYQRLEFLGDALLEMLCVNFLFYRFRNKGPQWLTEHKMAMVSNRFLAALAVKLEFYKHLRFQSSAIEAQNRHYVQEVKQAAEDADGAVDYWTNTSQPPKALSDTVESYLGAIFVDSKFDFKVVEAFFEQHIQSFFEDMSLYDEYANHHPVTLLQTRVNETFGCHGLRHFHRQIPSVVPGDSLGEEAVVAVVMIHSTIISEGSASSGKTAKLKASKAALELLGELSPSEYKLRFQCDCKNAAE